MMHKVLRTIVLAGAALLPATVHAGEWKAGIASVKITPSEPIWMAGYAARTEPAEGKEHDLFAKALALESPNGTRFVMVTLDLIGVTREIATDVRARVVQRLGLPAEALLFNASHTHCGPELRPERVGLWALPDDQGPKVAAYVRELTQNLFRVVQQSLKNLEPATLSVAQSSAGFAKNRRLPTENGFVNQEYDEGPTDHDVPVLSVRDADGKLTAILFGYACHNTTLSYQKWCGDYAGFAQLYIEKDNPGATALFMMGAGGDQNPYPRRTVELCQQHGRTLADSVQRALESPQTPITGELKSAYDEVILTFAPLPPVEQLRSQTQSTNKYEQRKAAYLLSELDAKGAVDLTYPCPVQVAQLGDQVLLVAVGGEVVVDYARRLKRELKGPMVWFAGYSNDVFGYLPSLRVLNEGGYEGGGAMLYGKLPGPFDQTVEDRVIQTVHQLVEQLKSGKSTVATAGSGS